MPWNSQGGGGGGPWGGGGGGQSPWGRPSGGGSQPPNIEEMLRRSQDKFRRLMPGGFGGGKLVALVVIAIIGIWLASGFYRVLPDEQGVVLRFGQYSRTTQPGLNYHLPTPIEEVMTPKVTLVNRVEIGYRGSVEGSTNPRGAGRQVPEEALMLTGDENIVDINFSVFWLIKDAGQFLFNIRSPEATVRAAAESAIRETVGRSPIVNILSEGRRKSETDAQHLLQDILDSYGAGISVTQVQLQKVDPPGPVIDAFRDVQRARADQERLRNEAEAYRNDIIPRARGEAERLIQEAEAFKQEVVNRSEGDAQRFLSVYKAFKTAPDVTTQRIYLETMEEILKGTSKVLIDTRAEGGAQGVVPYLPLPEIRRGSPQSTPQAAHGPGSSSGPAAAPQQAQRPKP
jgi:membrane protease subunit HflK